MDTPSMTVRRTLAAIAVVAIVVVGAIFVYVFYIAPRLPTASQNWAGYVDHDTVSSANASLVIPPTGNWSGDGVAGLWVGLGGAGIGAATPWPFWQAGAIVTCQAGACTVDLFDEGGTQGAPCNGICPINWSEPLGLASGMTVIVGVSTGSTGAQAHFVVEQDGLSTPYNPPAWTPLAGVSSFVSAEWIFESPTGSSGIEVMPTLAPPGVTFGSLTDSSHLGVMAPVNMENNPNNQGVKVSSLSSNSFTAYSFDK
jgi:hypothetical protein